MATNPEDIPGAEPQDDRDPNAQPDPNTNDQADDQQQEPITVEALASDMGWVPQEKYTGPAEKWKPADQFIRDGRDIQRNYAEEVRGLRSQLDTVAKTSAQILADRLEQQRNELTERYNQQVEDGDAAGSFKTAQELSKLDTKAPQSTAPSPAGQQFAERHSSWFGKDAIATQRAVDICNDLAAKGYSQEDQLRAAERTVKAEYPEYFQTQQQRQAPVVNQPGSRAAPSAGRAKTFADLPMAAQKVANDMVERGVIPDKEAYATRYWANAKA